MNQPEYPPGDAALLGGSDASNLQARPGCSRSCSLSGKQRGAPHNGAHHGPQHVQSLWYAVYQRVAAPDDACTGRLQRNSAACARNASKKLPVQNSAAGKETESEALECERVATACSASPVLRTVTVKYERTHFVHHGALVHVRRPLSCTWCSIVLLTLFKAGSVGGSRIVAKPRMTAQPQVAKHKTGTPF